MGLLLGASVLTVFELLDLLIYNLFDKLTTKKNKNAEKLPEKNGIDKIETIDTRVAIYDKEYSNNGNFKSINNI